MVSPRAFLADVPPELEQILFTAMASHRDERFAHAGLMAKALRAHPFARAHAEPPRHPLGTVLAVEEGQLVGPAHRLPANLPEPRPYTPIIASRLTLPMRAQPMNAPESQPSQDG